VAVYQAVGSSAGDEEEKKAEDLNKDAFPWKTAIALLVVTFLYVNVSQRNVAVSNLVPVVNVVALLAFLTYLFLSLRS
jgi:hypothetical protein